MRHVFGPAALAFALAWSAPSIAQDGPVQVNPRQAGDLADAEEQARYEDCLARIAEDPEQAYEDGLAWTSQGGGWPARHCAALALVSLGHPGEAGARMARLGEEAIAASDHTRAVLFGHAGDAFLEAEAWDEAAGAFERGLAFAPHDYGLAAGVAQARLSQGDAEAAERAATRAAAIDPRGAEAWRLRAEARLIQGELYGAESDMECGPSCVYGEVGAEPCCPASIAI